MRALSAELPALEEPMMNVIDRLSDVHVLDGQKVRLGALWQQQPVVLVIGSGGRLLYRYASREAGDHPDNRELLRALDDRSSEDAPASA